LVAIEQSPKNILQSGKFQGVKQGSHMLPEPFTAALFLQDRLEERKGQLLNLVDQKSQHHQQGKVDRQILFAVSVVMFEVVPLILERIEGFILDFPAGPSTSHQVKNVEFGHRQVGNPAKVVDFVALDFPIFNEVDLKTAFRLRNSIAVLFFHKKNPGSFRSLYSLFSRIAASLTGPGFIVLAFWGQFLMQAQHVMHFSLSIKLLFSESIAPTGHPSAQVPHCVHSLLIAIKSTLHSFVIPP
jgi:hypothetical protein